MAGLIRYCLSDTAYHIMFCDVFKIARLCYAWHLINITSVAPDIGIIYYSLLVALKMLK